MAFDSFAQLDRESGIHPLQGDEVEGLRGMGDFCLWGSRAIGYLPAAEAIFETLAENSLKLIALKGLLEKQVEKQEPLSAGAIRVMDLMDGLL